MFSKTLTIKTHRSYQQGFSTEGTWTLVVGAFDGPHIQFKTCLFHGEEWGKCCPENYRTRITVYLERHRIICKVVLFFSFFFKVCLLERGEMSWFREWYGMLGLLMLPVCLWQPLKGQEPHLLCSSSSRDKLVLQCFGINRANGYIRATPKCLLLQS